MKKWYRILNAFAAYSRGDIIAPEGLNRESLQVRGWITRQPVYIGPRKPTEAEVEAWAKAQAAPVVEPEPVNEAPVVEPAPVQDDIDEPDECPLIETATAPEPETAAIPRKRRRHN